MAVTGFDSGHGKVAEMDEALAQVDRLLRRIRHCPGDYPRARAALCEECIQDIGLMRTRIREVRGFRPLDSEEGER